MDQPGSWHHVMNRGIGRRTLFENSADIRFFLAELARAVRRGEIEVHAYAILTTHYHLLICSPEGRLADAMQRVQTQYSRRFNRSRRRDGSLVRGRYGSRPVESLRYRRVLVRYIDRNPVQAGLCARAADYPYGSAARYARAEGPPWLERSWVEGDACTRAGRAVFDPTAYEAAFGVLPEPLARVVEIRLASPHSRDPLDDLVGAAPPRVREWMRRKAKLADGSAPGLCAVDPIAIADVIRCRSQQAWPVRRGRRSRDGWTLARVALERELGGSTFERIGSGLSVTATTANNWFREHLALVEADEGYATTLSEMAAEILSAHHGGPNP